MSSVLDVYNYLDSQVSFTHGSETWTPRVLRTQRTLEAGGAE
ncbi:hypothetical protein PSCLAVI8L_320046 [Pseudoclavibacter sp. 8L]|nr:hypothetical protein PSCLAVI8L_320046 [Pseudoclavibacter sp. 8L]